MTTHDVFKERWESLEECYDELEKCPKCGSKIIVHIPSSTLPIDDEKGTCMGKKVPKETMKQHKSIKHICADCGLEW